jgi:hypothetical protein
MEETRNGYKVLLGSLRGRNHSEDIGVKGIAQW